MLETGHSVLDALPILHYTMKPMRCQEQNFLYKGFPRESRDTEETFLGKRKGRPEGRPKSVQSVMVLVGVGAIGGPAALFIPWLVNPMRVGLILALHRRVDPVDDPPKLLVLRAEVAFGFSGVE